MERNQGHVDGERAEFAVAADLVASGCRVSSTHGEYKYDLVADRDDKLLRVQVKKANRDADRPWKYRIFTDGYEDGEVDLFAGYIVDTETTFYVAAEAAGSECRVTTRSAAEMTDHNARLANFVDDYTLERAVSIHHDT